MAKTWSENKHLLHEIIEEMLINDSNRHNRVHILQFYENTMVDLYKQQYSFQNFTQLNKHVLSKMNAFVKTLQTQNASTNRPSVTPKQQSAPIFNSISETNHNPNITRQDIHKERESIIKQRMREKQEERDTMEQKKVKEIDFTDKTSEPTESIDDLLERELAKRNQEFSYDTTTQKKASDWIHSSSTNIPINEPTIPTLTIPTLTISKESFPIDTIVEKPSTPMKKQVRFVDMSDSDGGTPNTNETPIEGLSQSPSPQNHVSSSHDNPVTSNLLLKLKQIKKDKEVVTTDLNTKLSKNAVIQPYNRGTLHEKIELLSSDMKEVKQDLASIYTTIQDILYLLQHPENITLQVKSSDE